MWNVCATRTYVQYDDSDVRPIKITVIKVMSHLVVKRL